MNKGIVKETTWLEQDGHRILIRVLGSNINQVEHLRFKSKEEASTVYLSIIERAEKMDKEIRYWKGAVSINDFNYIKQSATTIAYKFKSNEQVKLKAKAAKQI